MSTVRVGRKPLYPWDQWFQRKLLILRHGEHYACMTHSMAQQVRNAAHERGLRVRIKIEVDYIIVCNHGDLEQVP